MKTAICYCYCSVCIIFQSQCQCPPCLSCSPLLQHYSTLPILQPCSQTRETRDETKQSLCTVRSELNAPASQKSKAVTRTASLKLSAAMLPLQPLVHCDPLRCCCRALCLLWLWLVFRHTSHARRSRHTSPALLSSHPYTVPVVPQHGRSAASLCLARPAPCRVGPSFPHARLCPRVR
jgi:hypothetical protein